MKRLITLSTDEDFCVHYKDVSPYLYRVWLMKLFAVLRRTKRSAALSAHVKESKELLEGARSTSRTRRSARQEAIHAYKLKSP